MYVGELSYCSGQLPEEEGNFQVGRDMEVATVDTRGRQPWSRGHPSMHVSEGMWWGAPRIVSTPIILIRLHGRNPGCPHPPTRQNLCGGILGAPHALDRIYMT